MKRFIAILAAAILSISTAFAAIEFSGSARVRPRYDLKLTKSGDETTVAGDVYFQYRAKLNIKGKMGNGFFFKGQISHNSPANWSKMGDGSDLPSTSSEGSAQAPSIAFTELCLGYGGEKLGYKLGRFGFAHNTILDIHYYPTKLLDIPFFIFNNNAITGAELNYKLGDHVLKGAVSLDENHLNYENYIVSEADSVIKDQEGFTGIFDAALKFDRITVSPSIILSRGKTVSNPFTAGTRVQYKNKGLLLKGEFAYSESFMADDLYAYSGYIFRAEMRQKMGPGTLRFMYDHSDMLYERFNGTTYADGAKYGKYRYTWLEYTLPLYKSDTGSVVARPVWRRYAQTMEETGETFIRHKIEVFFQYTF